MNQPAALPRIVGAKLPPRPVRVWTIRVRLQIERRVRDLALFDISLDSKLRGCDVVALRLIDVMAAGSVRRRATIIQQKTGQPVQFEIIEQTRRSLADWLNRRRGSPDEWLFPSRLHPAAHLSTRQYIRLVKQWVALIGLEPAAYGSHSLRRTKVSLLYRKTGNLRACQLLLGHTKLESTVRYLGVELDDSLTLSEGLEIQPAQWQEWVERGHCVGCVLIDDCRFRIGLAASGTDRMIPAA